MGIRIHNKSIEKLKATLKKITGRSNAMSMEYRAIKLRQIITGWINYFKLADLKGILRELDSWLRRRLRLCYWKQWKKIKTKHDNLVKLGIDNFKAWEYANTRKGYWRISNSPILARTLTNDYLKEHMGLRRNKIMKKRLGINTFNAIGAIIGAVLTGTMFAWMFSDATVAMYYGSGVMMLITNIIGLAKQKKAKGKLVGNILGIIAATFHTITGLLALPAMVLYIIASVFIFKNKVVLEVQ